MITACLGLIKSTSTQYDGGVVAIDSEKEFYRLQGDLYSLCRAKASFNNHLSAVCNGLKFKWTLENAVPVLCFVGLLASCCNQIKCAIDSFLLIFWTIFA
mgnify:FL=1